MKFVTFENSSSVQSIGTLDGAKIAILDGSENPFFASMLDLIEGGEPTLEAARTARASATTIDLDTVRLRAPLPVPVQMRDCLTFENHLCQCYSTMSKITPEARALEPEEVSLPQV
ncbi:MAG: hypothetical protein ABJL99_14200 [Aliishimia sp.]